MITGRAIKFLNRVYQTLIALRKCWRDGGYTRVHIAQIQHGEILRGKKILVTGGSRGIGYAIAAKCAAEGAQVVITGRDHQRLEEAVQRMHTHRVAPLEWDIADLSIIALKVEKAKELLGGDIDMLVNNAGILGRDSRIFDLTEQRWDEIISVNLKGLVFLTQHLVSDWMAKRRPEYRKILNITSMRGVLGIVDGPYGVSKWGLVGLTQGWGRLFLPHGIIVNAIAPGITDTSIPGIDTRENAYVHWNAPSHRAALPEEIAELAVFLLSDAANFIVGQTIVCDGGYSLRI